jgi:hypothetical protein
MPERRLNQQIKLRHGLFLWGKACRNQALTLIASGGLLWQAGQKGVTVPLPENSTDVDPITESDEVAMTFYDACIGSEFERIHGWHLNPMPKAALQELPPDWETRKSTRQYGKLTVTVPSADDLLVPKMKRGETRDLNHARWAFTNGVCTRSHTAPFSGDENRPGYAS